MNPLQSLGLRHQTDKADRYHTFCGRSYLDVYETYFAPIRDQVRGVLELGVYRGSSLKVWRDYFRNASVIGIDQDPQANQFYGERISVILGHQCDPQVLHRARAAAAAAADTAFDIIIDDGSHLVEHMLGSLDAAWGHLKPGGLYTIEDLANTYYDLTPYVQVRPGLSLNPPTTDFCNDRSRFDAALLARIAIMDKLQGDTAFIHFWPMQCILQKVN
jgi:hypothetical protein